jgi:protein arginine kinase activator
MLCMDCKEKPATVHVAQIVNNEKIELHLCFECAAKRGIQMLVLPVPPQPFFKPPFGPPQLEPGSDRTCSHCGFAWGDFLATGFLGCTRCYESFKDLLFPILEKNYGKVRHLGKIPSKTAAPLKIRREILLLKSEMEKAIQEEDFEKAARLRDQIRALEQQV